MAKFPAHMTRIAGQKTTAQVANEIELRAIVAELASGRPLGFSRPRLLRAREAQLREQIARQEA